MSQVVTNQVLTPPQHLLNGHVLPDIIRLLLRKWRLIALVIGVSLPLSVTVQLAYPTGRALPFAKIGERPVGLKSQADIKKALADITQQKFQARAAAHTYEVNLADLGVQFDTDQTLKRMTEYPLLQRLVPFSMLYYGKRHQSDRYQLRFNDSHLKAFAQKVAQDNSKPPVEGAIAIENGEVQVKTPQNGATYQPDRVIEAVRAIGPRVPQSLVLPATVAVPKYTEAEITKSAQAAQRMAATPLTVSVAGHTQKLDSQTILSWLKFVPNEATHEIQVDINREAIKASIKSLADQVYIAPGVGVITYLDGVEIARNTAAVGRALDFNATADAVVVGLRTSQSAITAKVVEVAAGRRSNRTYSNTSKGLQALLNDWRSDHPGGRWGITVIELDSQGRSAGVREGDQFVSASIYKLFVSYAVQSKIERGEIDPNAKTSTGNTVDACLEYMIVVSNNPCGEALGEMVGWSTVTAMAQAAGFSATSVNRSSGFLTTAHDTALYLQKLYGGSLLGADQSARLLNKMRRQVYRDGIPLGSSGSAVADKVGFIFGYRHDVAIVYHPKGTYILSIMSFGGTNTLIADLARTVSNYMSQ